MFRKIISFIKSGPRTVEDIVPFPEGKRIYRDAHNLRREQMDEDALKVVNRLNRHGHRSFLVGGCVRDMILGKRPKDFDVVTNATPSQIRKVFSNSRPIGKRFKIMHILFRGGKVIEVSTFRGLPSHRLNQSKAKDQELMLHRDNQFGSPVEDAARRDFTINALFFDPRNDSIIDYVGGYDDIKNRRIRVIGDPDISFREDPVRMLRAVKFAALLKFELDSSCVKAIRRNKEEILKASPSRMLEEYYKIFRTGKASEIFASLAENGLFRTLFPEISAAADAKGAKPENFLKSPPGIRFAIADKMLSEREELTSNIFLAIMLLDLAEDVFRPGKITDTEDYLHSRLEPALRRMNLPQKDKERIYSVFSNISRFERREDDHPSRSENFRKKIFFFETFMVYKIYAISVQDEKAIQQAMFWEIGPRSRPPEPHKIISVFPRKNYHRPEFQKESSGNGDEKENAAPSKKGRPGPFRRKKRKQKEAADSV